MYKHWTLFKSFTELARSKPDPLLQPSTWAQGWVQSPSSGLTACVHRSPWGSRGDNPLRSHHCRKVESSPSILEVLEHRIQKRVWLTDLMEKTKPRDVVGVQVKGSNWKLTRVAGPGMDALGQHTSTYSMFSWVWAGPSIEGHSCWRCASYWHTLFNTKISYKLRIICITF